jgi:hypothetical protein
VGLLGRLRQRRRALAQEHGAVGAALLDGVAQAGQDPDRGLGRGAVDVDRDPTRPRLGLHRHHRRRPRPVARLVGQVDHGDLGAGDGLAVGLGAAEEPEHRLADQLLAERRRAELPALAGAAAVLVAGGPQGVGRRHGLGPGPRGRRRARRPGLDGGLGGGLDHHAGPPHLGQGGVGLEEEAADRRATGVDHRADICARQRPGRVRRARAGAGPHRREPSRQDGLGLGGGRLGQRRQDPDAIEGRQRHVLAQVDPLLRLAHQHDRDRRLLVQLHQRREHAGHAVGADQAGDRLDLIEAQDQRPGRAHAQRAQDLEGPGLVGHAGAQVEGREVFVGQLGGAQPVDDRPLGVTVGDPTQHLAEVRRQGRQRQEAATALVQERAQPGVLLGQVAERHRELLAADQRLIDALDDVVVIVGGGVGADRDRDLAQRVPQEPLEGAGRGQPLDRVARDVGERRGQILERRHVDAHVLTIGAAPQVRELVGLAHPGIAGDEHHLRPPLAGHHRDRLGDRQPRRRVDRRHVGRRQRVGVEPGHRVGERASVEEDLGQRHRYLRAT